MLVLTGGLACAAELTAEQVRSTARGTHAGEFLGVPVTGRRVEFSAFDFHQVADGRFRTSWHVEDNLGLLAQIRPAGRS